MGFGLVIFVIGYSIFYWGQRHFGHQCRYPLGCLLGFGPLFKNLNLYILQPTELGQKPVAPSLPSNIPAGTGPGTQPAVPPMNPQFVQGA